MNVRLTESNCIRGALCAHPFLHISSCANVNMATQLDTLVHLRDTLATVRALYVDCCNSVPTRLEEYHRNVMNQHLRECVAANADPEVLEALIDAGADDVKFALKSLVEKPHADIFVACHWANKYQRFGLNRAQVLEVPFANNPTLVLFTLANMGDFDTWRALVNDDFTHPAVTNGVLRVLLWNMGQYKRFDLLGRILKARRAKDIPARVVLPHVLRNAALCNDEAAVELVLNAGTDTPLELSAALAMYCRLRREDKILALLARGAFPTGSMLDDLVAHHEFLGVERQAHDNMLVQVIPRLIMHGVALPKAGSETERIVRELVPRLIAVGCGDPVKTQAWVQACLLQHSQSNVATGTDVEDGNAALKLESNCHFRPNVAMDSHLVTVEL